MSHTKISNGAREVAALSRQPKAPTLSTSPTKIAATLEQLNAAAARRLAANKGRK
jgi:hypothetical protein